MCVRLPVHLRVRLVNLLDISLCHKSVLNLLVAVILSLLEAPNPCVVHYGG